MEPLSENSSEQSSHDRLGPVAMICAMLAFAAFPKLCNHLPTLLGLYFHAVGVKRRTIGVLARLGVIPGYQTIRRKLTDLANIRKLNPPPCKWVWSSWNPE